MVRHLREECTAERSGEENRSQIISIQRPRTSMKTIAIISAGALAVCAGAYASEGMWTPDNLPAKELQSKYKFTPAKQWVDHAQKAALRLAGGCSGSFVSSSGLLPTNHHCVNSCVMQLSTAEKDFIASGFYAKEQ